MGLYLKLLQYLFEFPFCLELKINQINVFNQINQKYTMLEIVIEELSQGTSKRQLYFQFIFSV